VDEGLQRALNAIHSGQYADAQQELERLLKAEEGCGEAWFYLGCLEQRRLNADGARNCYEQARQRLPLAWQPLFNLALVALEQRQTTEARQLLERAALLASDVVEVRWRLAVVCEEAGDLDEARYWYEAVAGLDPEHAGARFRLGMLALSRGELETATTHLQGCQSGHPDAAVAAYNLGLCHFKASRWREARVCFERAHMADPTAVEYLLALAVLALSQQDLDRAERHERELREGGAETADLCFNLARAWLERGQPERARRLFRQAVIQEPSLASGYFR
jgi:Flp pilus assembly protein TadD